MDIKDLSNSIKFLELFFLEFFTILICFKNMNYKMKKSDYVYFVFLLFSSGVVLYIRQKFSYLMSIILMIFFLNYLLIKITKKNIGVSIVNTIISVTINYILIIIVIIIVFFINKFFSIKNDFLNLIILTTIQTSVLVIMSKMKRVKYGISYLNSKNQNDILDITILNICAIILFVMIIFSKGSKYMELSKSLIFIG